MKSKTKWLATIATLAVVFVLVLSLGLSTIFASADDDAKDSSAGRFYGDYSSQEQVDQASEDMNVAVAEEGITLLKNDGTLPLSKGAFVSVLGIAQDTINETTGSVSESLKDAGFNVNPTLEEYYLNDDATYKDYGSESALNAAQRQSMSLYSDAAIVVIGRGTPGESEDNELATEEEETDTYLGNSTGWKHEAHEQSADGSVEYKHELQLTESEEELIKLAEQYCKKVVVLYTSSYIFEMANLDGDPLVNAIAWIGRLGNGGIKAVGEILCGDVNPSGKVVDEWTRDFTNDPTYANVFDTSYIEDEETIPLANPTVSDYSGLDYEEDIYLGYKFYETYWKEAHDNTGSANPTDGADAWYEYNVVYPFGYGLSYTTFEYGDVTLEADVASSLTSDDSYMLSDVYNNANQSGAKSFTATLDVTNTGDVAGKEVVEVYVQAPYDSSSASLEKPAWTLAGFAKTGEIKPGKTETVSVTFNLQDIASYDYVGGDDKVTGYTLEQGTYNVHVMESSSHLNMEKDGDIYVNPAYSTTSFSLASTIVMDLDDFSGNKIENLFSGSDGTESNGDEWKDDYYSMVTSADAGTMISPLEAAADVTSQTKSTMLSRADFDGTMPKAPQEGEGTLSEDTIKLLHKFEDVYADTFDDTVEPWYVGPSDLGKLAGWTQGAGVVGDNGMYPVVMDDMAGVPLYNDDGSVNSAWTAFMNQLTWEEMTLLLEQGQHNTIAISTIGKLETADENGPNYTGDTENREVGEPTTAATWNTDLCERFGMTVANVLLYQDMTGWYAPGMNTHRSAFSGRTPEYYSQDGIHGGYIAAAVVRGATSRGINVNIKHFAGYDIADMGGNGCVNVSEQALREIYLKPFQMSMQEGGAHAAMTAFVRIGAVYASQNYALTQALARDEWGWTGYFMTDATGSIPNMTMDGLVRAGAELPDSNDYTNNGKQLSGSWNETFDWANDSIYGVTWSAMVDDQQNSNGPVGCVMVGEEGSEAASPTQWYLVRMGAMRILYNQCNSAGNYNGITNRSLSYAATSEQGQSFSMTIIDDNDIDVTTEHFVSNAYVVSGSLPNGLSLSNGVIGGTILDAGDFSFTLEVIVDGWIKVEVNVSISNTSILTVLDDVSSVAVGDSVDTYVWYNTSNVSYTDDISFAVVDGSLPAGMRLNETSGRLYGTPTEAGTYTFTVAVTATDPDNIIVNIPDSQLELVTGSFGISDEVAKQGFLGQGSYAWLAPYADSFQVTFDADTATYYMAYTIDVAEGTSEGGSADAGSSTGVTSEELEKAVQDAVDAAIAGLDLSGSGSSDGESESGGNGMAITGLVLGIVAIVLAVAVLVIVLLRRNKKSDD